MPEYSQHLFVTSAPHQISPDSVSFSKLQLHNYPEIFIGAASAINSFSEIFESKLSSISIDGLFKDIRYDTLKASFKI